MPLPCFSIMSHIQNLPRHKLLNIHDDAYSKLRRAQVQDLVKPRRSVSLPLPSMVDVNSFPRKSCSYSMLSEEPIKLSVRKLDGSSFDVEVIKSATIAELKLAVQHVFSHMLKKGPGMISWPHVWGHFCLCYHGLKLLKDTDHIMNYGIKDGDQLLNKIPDELRPGRYEVMAETKCLEDGLEALKKEDDPGF
ncbi:hypothetical protein V6N11_072300 [Hibiscus sabdariffa]|uniref:SNRNP25 ubiquitin-like domain-containing protein n=1 Tax=Hibiscus sabdariffa TaxID=183260 RepID=A0ABR2U2N5_9ROSI